ncbi:hypothetical protein cypCar_00007639 [Cyprinus carpio]|nr:hypothetical protein cypCar_00007639 [Cyprinus carpio]
MPHTSFNSMTLWQTVRTTFLHATLSMMPVS